MWARLVCEKYVGHRARWIHTKMPVAERFVPREREGRLAPTPPLEWMLHPEWEDYVIPRAHQRRSLPNERCAQCGTRWDGGLRVLCLSAMRMDDDVNAHFEGIHVNGTIGELCWP
jgi:hypothetical protein